LVTDDGRQPIPSKRFSVWQRLYNRYTLEPGPVAGLSPPAVSTLIAPTTDADRLLSMPDVRQFSFPVVAQATVTMTTVPAGERWTVRFVRSTVDTGTWTHSRVDVKNPAGDDIPINIYTATTTKLVEPTTPFVLDELWELRLNVNSFTSGGDGELQILIDVEDAF